MAVNSLLSFERMMILLLNLNSFLKNSGFKQSILFKNNCASMFSTSKNKISVDFRNCFHTESTYLY